MAKLTQTPNHVRSEDWEQWHSKDYDYIHTRMAVGCFADFQKEIVERSFEYLQPGGWFEAQELDPTMRCDDGTLTDDNPLVEWANTLMSAAAKSQRPVDIAPKLREWMRQAGFVDVRERVFKMPINNWPLEPQYKRLGRLWQQNLDFGLQGLSLALLSRVEGWKPEEIEVFLVNVRKALFDPSVHAYNRVHVVVGRKPGAGSNSGSTGGSGDRTPSDEEMGDV